VDPAFPDEPLRLFGPGTDSGTFDFFTDEITGEEGASRTDYSPSENDNVTVEGVAGEKGGLGYFGLSYFEQNKGKVAAVQVDSGKGCVGASSATVQDGTYTPLSRPLYVYVKKASFARPEVKAFLEYILANETTIAEEALFVPLTAPQLETAKTALTAIG
jgi:phosphate transport system substrate-binding protein